MSPVEPSTSFNLRPWSIWIVSFGVWSLVSLFAAISFTQFFRARGDPMRFWVMLAMEACQIMPYAVLTPFVLALAMRFPIRRKNWLRRLVLYLAAGLLFSVAHITLRGITPYGMWDPKTRSYYSAVWDSRLHRIHIRWPAFQDMFYSNVVDDITDVFAPIVIVAHMISYYWRVRDGEHRAAQLEGQLTKANLQALKSQLQPHFLFNTLHSISALMLTDVGAADKMMTRLSELLRMSLETDAEQMTTLNRELDFVGGYLEIEKMRLGERLTVIHDIAADTLDAQVPHLLLQPLVENAVQHGVAKMTSKGEIVITSRQEEGILFLTVRDNGPGFNGVDMSARSGVGIRATQERLRTLYGDDHSLKFATLRSGGAEVTIRVPMRQILNKV
jgi:two-component system, LytTR family, sensor kinase